MNKTELIASSTSTAASRFQLRRRSRRTLSREMSSSPRTVSCSFTVSSAPFRTMRACRRQAISSSTVRFSSCARGSSSVTSG